MRKPYQFFESKKCNRFISILTMVLLLGGCATPPPNNIYNACQIVQQYPEWYYNALDSYKKWGIPISTQFAIILQESHFIATARPKMDYTLGFIPSGRPSSAYGYAQALDGTWQDYRDSTGNLRAKRDNFADATDFIGWYGANANRRANIPKDDTYNLYLAYHQGIAAYQRQSYHELPGIMRYAQKAQNWAYRYADQLRHCHIPSRPWSLF